jgi:hypothetical protein
MRNTELDEYKLEAGVLISKVKRFSKADNQRLFAGLVITEVDRKKIETVSDLEDIHNKRITFISVLIFRDAFFIFVLSIK